ncbi:MBL fold metallo-hydrolase [Pseudooceanicola sediminis]|uniref:MBL fold metallo-hydrolase n=1 Tax=Pseudooceanicola sediminis TaxID=2211117 RepID=A0A399J5T4_9RHOB|nr:MBL fold metallo-hydrolase [Pseudooceanicola sediminis]KAA2316045.1 MBL fold metallo-hydrolase [Puniceibacterium sp. HSS470]RII38156.1 MBL fold metallo-hydrolase [Pseudooceanicola sediminis]|tara:strand:- start:28339 stop:29136 length:798 start_codon:yes stop_codon:yes gene_type:complete
MKTLPVAEHWYVARRLDGRITLITEPHVHPIFSANMYLVEGTHRDLLIDSGMGVAPLRPFVDGLRRDARKPLISLTTHTHVDHFGAVQEFDIRLVHEIEAGSLADPAPYSLNAAALSPGAMAMFAAAGYPPLWPMLIDALPHAGYEPADYVLWGAAPTDTVADGDVISLGDWQAEVLHLPGHSAGQVGVWHGHSGTLFGADAIYDGPLIWEGAGYDVAAYARTLRRIRELPVRIVHGGHDQAFGRARMIEICDAYLGLWAQKRLI